MTPEPDAAARPDTACPPCRGTGRVVSSLGGTPSEVTCPWCEGSGRFDGAHDAQAARITWAGADSERRDPPGDAA